MKAWWEWVQSEPVALIEAVRGVIACLILFGTLNWSGEQTAGFMLAFGLVFGLVARQAVTPNINVRSRVNGSKK